MWCADGQGPETMAVLRRQSSLAGASQRLCTSFAHLHSGTLSLS